MTRKDLKFAFDGGKANGALCAKLHKEDGCYPAAPNLAEWKDALWCSVTRLAKTDAEHEKLEAEFVKGCVAGYAGN